MTKHTTPVPGDLRVCVIAAPGHVVATPAPDAAVAQDIRGFSTASSTIARAHGVGGTFPSDAYIERFNGEQWVMAPAVIESCPWRVVTVQGVFRFATFELANLFAIAGEPVEFAPDAELARI